MATPIAFTALGDRAVTITLGDVIDERTHQLVHAVSRRLDEAPPHGMVDQVPAFLSVTVHYDPDRVPGTQGVSPYDRLVETLRSSLASVHAGSPSESRRVEIPVCYGGDLGPDLDDVARLHELTPDDVVRLHSEAEYLVYMVGFMPGFAYLGGLPSRLVTPRQASPRVAVPAGSVGIGGEQTGVYPLESPGGWNLIGRTPLRVFDPTRTAAALLASGDRVTFCPITRDNFYTWRQPS